MTKKKIDHQKKMHWPVRVSINSMCRLSLLAFTSTEKLQVLLWLWLHVQRPGCTQIVSIGKICEHSKVRQLFRKKEPFSRSRWMGLCSASCHSTYREYLISYVKMYDEWNGCLSIRSRLNNQWHTMSWNICLLLLPLSLNKNIPSRDEKKWHESAAYKWNDHYLEGKNSSSSSLLIRL